MRKICAGQVYVLTRQVKMASPKGIAKLANPNHGGNPKRCGNKGGMAIKFVVQLPKKETF